MPKQATLTFFKSKKNGQWYWSLTQPNGRKTADGCEGYQSLSGAKRGYAATLKKMANAKIIVQR